MKKETLHLNKESKHFGDKISKILVTAGVVYMAITTFSAVLYPLLAALGQVLVLRVLVHMA